MAIFNPVFIDTWGWISLGHRKEREHNRSVEFYKNLRKNNVLIYTTDYILDEVFTLIFRRENFKEALLFSESVLTSGEKGFIFIEHVTHKYFTLAWELRKLFKDKPYISFTDLTSMAVMKSLGISYVFTDDRHFSQTGMGFIIVPEKMTI